MGEVWRGFDETLGRPLAVKFLLPQVSDPTAASRFRLEAQTAGRLSHPHVVDVLDFGAYENRMFLVMELVEGDSIARLLAAAGPLPAEWVARTAAEAAAGLAAAHRQGIVHRDIKPANLLLDADGALKIGGFGVARFLDDPGAALTATGQIVGTSLYLAPERALGRTAGPASDVYSLGGVLYQLLTGSPPFQADTALAVLHQHLDATPRATPTARRESPARLRELPAWPAGRGARGPARGGGGGRLIRARGLARDAGSPAERISRPQPPGRAVRHRLGRCPCRLRSRRPGSGRLRPGGGHRVEDERAPGRAPPLAPAVPAAFPTGGCAGRRRTVHRGAGRGPGLVLARHRLGAGPSDRAVHEHEPRHIPVLRARRVPVFHAGRHCFLTLVHAVALLIPGAARRQGDREGDRRRAEPQEGRQAWGQGQALTEA